MGLLDLTDIDPRVAVVEKVMVAFGAKGGSVLLAWWPSGTEESDGPVGCVDCDVDSIGGDRADDFGLGDPGEGWPRPRVLVWEGVPKPIGHGEDFEGFEYATEGWREPTSQEWARLAAGAHPFVED